MFRGMYEGRYRDHALLAFQSEYRFPIHGRFSGVAFGSYGDVAGFPGAFRLESFKWAVGTGLRFAWYQDKRINTRLDAAVTEEGQGAYLTMGEAF